MYEFKCVYLFILLIDVIKTLKASNIDNLPCTQMTACSCHYPNNLLIDLSDIIVPSAPNETNYLTVSNNSAVFFYQPCYDLNLLKTNGSVFGALWMFTNTSENGPINPAAALAGNVTNVKNFHAADARWKGTEFGHKSAFIEYSNSTKIALKCNPSSPSTFLEISNIQTDSYSNTLILTSPSACVREFKLVETSETSEFSTGTILVVIFLSFALFYFIIGGLVLKFVRGAQGWEMIPNHEFWLELPGLVRDGYIFATTCGTIRPECYERI